MTNTKLWIRELGFPGEWMEIMQYNLVHAEVPDVKSDFVRHGSSYKAKFC